MSARYFAIFCSIVIIGFIIDLIRREKMSYKYALIWLGIGAGVLVFSVFDGLLVSLSRALGFTLASNFVFFTFVIFTIFFNLLLTIYINEQSHRTESLVKTIGILEYKVQQLKDKMQKTGSD